MAWASGRSPTQNAQIDTTTARGMNRSASRMEQVRASSQRCSLAGRSDCAGSGWPAASDRWEASRAQVHAGKGP